MTFDIITEPWIPVLTLEGERKELSLFETLQQAHTLKEVSVVSPLEEFGIYRFLTLFLMAALEPDRARDIKDLLKYGKFDMSIIDQYIHMCRIEGCGKEGSSFDLFDEKRPFLQATLDPDLEKKGMVSLDVLDFFVPSGNNAVHFTHADALNQGRTPAQALRLILAHYLFHTMGGNGYYYGINGAPPYFGVVMGTTLFETLVYQLYPLQSIGYNKFDRPPVFWRTTKVLGKTIKISTVSWLEGMLFPARRIRLVEPEEGNLITNVYYGEGPKFETIELPKENGRTRKTSNWRDPHVIYRGPLNISDRMMPKANVPFWKNIAVLLDPSESCASPLLHWYNEHLRDSSSIINLRLYGAATDKASYEAVFRHDLHFQATYLEQEFASELLTKCINAASRLEWALKKSLDEDQFLKNIQPRAVNAFCHEIESEIWALCACDITEETAKNIYQNFVERAITVANNAYTTALQSVSLRARNLVIAAEQKKILLFEIANQRKEVNLLGE